MTNAAIHRIGVIGGGMMGQGIALDFALAGRNVTLYNTRPQTSDRALAGIERALDLLIETDLTTPAGATAALGRLTRTTLLAAAAADHDLIVETVLEDLDLKRQIFRDLERHAPPGAILATDTSSLPVDAIAEACARPERVLAMHNFHPAHLVPLVEVGLGRRTDPTVVAVACRLLEMCGKRPLVIERPLPGFLGNRLQNVLRNEALRLVEDGQATPEQIDQAISMGVARKYSIVGIFDRMDLVGLDLAARVFESIGTPVPAPIADHVARGEYGVRTGRGFYDWPEGAVEALQDHLDRHLIHLLKLDRAAGRVRVPSPYTCTWSCFRRSTKYRVPATTQIGMSSRFTKGMLTNPKQTTPSPAVPGRPRLMTPN
ncbi:MAG TPA: 3-hydroxyacyl-CoA dehydrogenase family protein [Dehalococcoidia bacterium]|nr:3-hydroxyacyl-CoA dehydrogenase family protein [Dehalococcoidia bacterium]